jgi:hypothetical protein
MPFGASKGQRVIIFYFGFFFGQKVSIILQRMQASSILNRVVVVGLATS